MTARACQRTSILLSRFLPRLIPLRAAIGSPLGPPMWRGSWERIVLPSFPSGAFPNWVFPNSPESGAATDVSVEGPGPPAIILSADRLDGLFEEGRFTVLFYNRVPWIHFPPKNFCPSLRPPWSYRGRFTFFSAVGWGPRNSFSTTGSLASQI